MKAYERLLKYITVWTTSDENGTTVPTTKRQLDLGNLLVEEMKEVNPQKLHQDICGINKKYKLELTNPSVNDVTEWIQKLN